MIAEFFNSPYASAAVFAVVFAVVGFLGVRVLKKNRHVSQLPDENFPEGAEQDEQVEEIPMGLCATKAGKKTHYRKLGKAGLYKRVKGKPTLCGVKVHHDLEDQDAEASCQTCNEALSKFGYPFV